MQTRWIVIAGLIAAAAATLVHPPRWPQARGHAPWVEEVWANLIANAIQYGGRPPHIELGADEEWAGQVRFWVRDNGDGIKPELQERLFQDGARLAPTRERWCSTVCRPPSTAASISC